jgi:hypothetical protein
VATEAQTGATITSNPIPEPVVKKGVAVEIRDLVRWPDAHGLRPADQDVMPEGWARVSFISRHGQPARAQEQRTDAGDHAVTEPEAW